MGDNFKAFEPKKPCLQSEKCFDHPSCCNLDDFLEWLKNLLKPLKEYEEVNPYPRFKRIRPCSKKFSDHCDSPFCCNWDVHEKFKNVTKMINESVERNCSGSAE